MHTLNHATLGFTTKLSPMATPNRGGGEGEGVFTNLVSVVVSFRDNLDMHTHTRPTVLVMHVAS